MCTATNLKFAQRAAAADIMTIALMVAHLNVVAATEPESKESMSMFHSGVIYRI